MSLQNAAACSRGSEINSPPKIQPLQCLLGILTLGFIVSRLLVVEIRFQTDYKICIGFHKNTLLYNARYFIYAPLL